MFNEVVKHQDKYRNSWKGVRHKEETVIVNQWKSWVTALGYEDEGFKKQQKTLHQDFDSRECSEVLLKNFNMAETWPVPGKFVTLLSNRKISSQLLCCMGHSRLFSFVLIVSFHKACFFGHIHKLRSLIDPMEEGIYQASSESDIRRPINWCHWHRMAFTKFDTNDSLQYMAKRCKSDMPPLYSPTAPSVTFKNSHWSYSVCHIWRCLACQLTSHTREREIE